MFPALKREHDGKSLIYFDNAATTLKHVDVIRAVEGYYSQNGANIHRGRHYLSEEASEIYEECRQRAARFLNASTAEIVFTHGTTHSINIVADGLNLQAGDNVVGSVLEHHSNILPWASRCTYRPVALNENGLPDIEQARQLINKNTRLIAITHVSNVTGVIVPVEQWCRLAQELGVPILIDAAQAASHIALDTQKMGCDFLALSAHKMFGPSGCGVLYGSAKALRSLKVKTLGGGAVSRVYADGRCDLRDIPWRFESGTPPIASVIGLNQALRYIESIGIGTIAEKNDNLARTLYDRFSQIDGLEFMYSQSKVPRVPIISLTNVRGDVATRVLSDSYGIMTRGGHHCAHPLHESLQLTSSLRLSLHHYNTEAEIKAAFDALEQLKDIIRS